MCFESFMKSHSRQSGEFFSLNAYRDHEIDLVGATSDHDYDFAIFEVIEICASHSETLIRTCDHHASSRDSLTYAIEIFHLTHVLQRICVDHSNFRKCDSCCHACPSFAVQRSSRAQSAFREFPRNLKEIAASVEFKPRFKKQATHPNVVCHQNGQPNEHHCREFQDRLNKYRKHEVSAADSYSLECSNDIHARLSTSFV